MVSDPKNLPQQDFAGMVNQLWFKRLAVSNFTDEKFAYPLL